MSSLAPPQGDKPTRRGRRSSSIIAHVPAETVEEESDQIVDSNMNANWVNSKGAWGIHIFIIVLLKTCYDLIPALTQEQAWTFTNLTYVIGSYIMFHGIKGVPFDFNGGAYDYLTMWEQIDGGDQYTPSKKFLLGVPVGLFLISTHYSKYDLNMFIFNGLICLVGVIPKLPSTHRLRVNIPGVAIQPGTEESEI